MTADAKRSPSDSGLPHCAGVLDSPATVTRALLEAMARPLGPPTPLISFEAFLDEIAPLDAVQLAATLTTFSWRAWEGTFPTQEGNTLSIALAAHIALLAFARGAIGGRPVTPIEAAALHFRYLAIDSTSDAVVRPFTFELAALARGQPWAVAIPDLASAQMAVSSFSLVRMLRMQWLAGRTRFDELSRVWWITRRIGAQAANLDNATRNLGMSVPTFVRAAAALIALAATSEPERGRIDLSRGIDKAFTEKYDVDPDTLRLAASKLATSRSDLELWLQELLTNSPAGLRQYAPSPLASTPLLRVDEFADPPREAHTLFLCPSIYYLIGAVRDRVKEAFAGPGQITADTLSLYGNMLSDYVGVCIADAGRVTNVDHIDGDERRADWLLSDDDSVLFIEVKRAMATGVLSRHLVTAKGMASVIDHLYGAYDQCRATFERRRWVGLLGALPNAAAVILVDEGVAGEGAVLSDLLVCRTSAGSELPFEVMSVSEFENAIHVLGLKRLTAVIRAKWARYAGLPANIYFTRIMGCERETTDTPRRYIEAEDAELFIDLAFSAAARGSDWPL